MQCAITDAKARLTDLVRKAEKGEDVVLTRHGHEVVRLVPIRTRSAQEGLAGKIAAIQADVADDIAAGRAERGAGAACSQDFLYDEDGMPK